MNRIILWFKSETANLRTVCVLSSLVFMFITGNWICVLAQDQNVIIQQDGDGDDNKKDKVEPFTVGFMFGPAIPSTSIADIYDLAGDDGVGDAYDVAANLGYDIGFRGRYGIGENLSLSGGIMYVSFPSNDLWVKDSAGQRTLVQTATYIIPLYAGFAVMPMRGTITPMLGVHAMYTYRGTVVSEGNIVKDVLEPGQELEPAVSRVGASIELSAEFDLGLRPLVSLMYVWSNLIGNEENEAIRSFLTVNVGLMF